MVTIAQQQGAGKRRITRLMNDSKEVDAYRSGKYPTQIAIASTPIGMILFDDGPVCDPIGAMAAPGWCSIDDGCTRLLLWLVCRHSAVNLQVHREQNQSSNKLKHEIRILIIIFPLPASFVYHIIHLNHKHFHHIYHFHLV
jgi:hypothetical protein